MLEEIDNILSHGNEHFTGEEIRKALMLKAYIVVKTDNMPINKFSCHVCGCESEGAFKYIGWNNNV